MSKIAIPTFESRYDAICFEIDKRSKSWTLASTPFEDVRQEALARISLKYYTYDPRKAKEFSSGLWTEEKTFLHWVNTVISSVLRNSLRDNWRKFNRPCVADKCVFNTGGDTCSKTTSGLQCSECLAYKLWEQRKLQHFNVAQTLPLENHQREADAMQSDFIDIDGRKKTIDEKMKAKLNRHEWKVYKLLYVQGKTEREVGEVLKYKKSKNAKMYAGYQAILRMKHKFVELAREIIEEENLA